MNDATKHAIERTIRFIQDYRVESATGYGAWEIWVKDGDYDHAEERAECRELLAGNWAPGLQHALTIRAGDQRGSHCAELWVTGAIYAEARELVRTYIPLGTTMGDDEDGFRIEVSGLLLTRAEAEAALAVREAELAAREAGRAAAELAEAQAELAAAADEVADMEEPGEEDETVEAALARVIASLPPEVRASLPEAGATWRQVGEALRRSDQIHRDI